MRLAMVLHPSRQTALDAARAVVAEAATRGIPVTVRAEDAARIPEAETWESDTPPSVDLVVAVGGDGTMLEAARLARPGSIPVIGVNAGTIGFLTEVDPSLIADMLDRLVEGRFQVGERMTVRARMPDGTEVDALNDVVTEKSMRQHVVTLAVLAGGDLLAEYRADAVIVATPTGSTAYTFSAGGPLVDPEFDSLVVTAVAPHSLFGRAVVFDPGVVLEVEVIGERPAIVHADGRIVGDLAPGDRLTVARGPLRDRIVRLDDHGFTRSVRDRFPRRHA